MLPDPLPKVCVYDDLLSMHCPSDSINAAKVTALKQRSERNPDPARDICLRSAALPPWCTVSACPIWTTLVWNGDYPGPLNFLGALLILAGAVLLAWTLTTMLLVARRLPPRVGLGLRPAQLVQTGPYARMRHPMYVAESCFWLGIIVLFGSPVVAAVFICLAGIAMTWIMGRSI